MQLTRVFKKHGNYNSNLLLIFFSVLYISHFIFYIVCAEEILCLNLKADNCCFETEITPQFVYLAKKEVKLQL